MVEPIITNKPVVNYTLDDYNEQLKKASMRFLASSIAEDAMQKNCLADMLYMGYKPPTRWQRFKYRIEDIKQRFKDIWTIVSGGDIHRDCGY